MQTLVERATEGDRQALETLLTQAQADVYRLALRMLWHPEDAEDATQEIVIRIMTHLGGFKGQSDFKTWVYRVAANYLLTTRRRRAERPELTFEEFGRQLADGLEEGPDWQAASPERRLLIEEVKIGCSQAMLLCLDREHRLAYILGEILELPGPVAAAVVDVTAAAFRKRLSRARSALEAFMQAHCGLVSQRAPCRCHKRIGRAISTGHVDPANLRFARRSEGDSIGADAILAGARAVEDLRHEASAIQRSNPALAPPGRLVGELRRLLASSRFRVLRA